MRAPTHTAAPQQHPHCQRGFSLLELLIVVAIILIIAAIAIPNLLHAKIAAHEAAAAEVLCTITTAAVTYSSTYGNGYPATLANLGGPPQGVLPLASCPCSWTTSSPTPPVRRADIPLPIPQSARR